jgi:periplasmic protein TonB
MKTSNKAVAKSIAVSLDDVIFSKRNQNYGAYYLRKKYSKHLFYAVFYTFVFVLAGAGYLQYKNSHKSTISGSIPFDTTRVIMDTLIDFVPPQPPPVKPDMDEVVRNSGHSNDIISIVDTLLKTDVRDFLIPEIINQPVDTGIKLVYVKPDSSLLALGIEDNKVYTHVEEPATFRGGNLEDFHNWVKENIVYPTTTIEAGIGGKVFLNFLVNTQGEVSDINITRGVHPLINEETVRVLMNSPRWHPARQNGKAVKQRFYMQVSYIIQ